MPTIEELAKICQSYTPFSLAAFYNWVSKDVGFTLPAHMWPVCLALTDVRIRNLQIIVGPGSTKSYLLSTIFPAWLIGHDPTMTILGISAAENLMNGFMQSVQRVIESSEAFHACFPNVKPDKSAGWSSERGIFVTGHPPAVPDANFFGCGLNSSALTGKHSRIVLCDDIHDKNNAATAEGCKQVVDAYFTTILGRAVATGTRFITAGRRWNNDDLYGALMESGYYVTMRLPFEREGSTELYWDISVPDDVECVFTDRKVLCADGEWITV